MRKKDSPEKLKRYKKIQDMTKKGYKRMDIAAILGCSTGTVGLALKAAGMLDPKRVEGGKRGQIRLEKKRN